MSFRIRFGYFNIQNGSGLHKEAHFSSKSSGQPSDFASQNPQEPRFILGSFHLGISSSQVCPPAMVEDGACPGMSLVQAAGRRKMVRSRKGHTTAIF